MAVIDVILADNQPLTLSGLTQFVAGELDIRVAGTARTHVELLACLNARIRLLVIDPREMISGPDILRIRTDFPEINIVVVSTITDRPQLVDLIKSGIHGYITKYADQTEVLTAIRTVAKGEKYFCQDALNIIIETSIQSPTHRAKDALTSREKELLKLIAQGYSNQRAADELNLSPHTVHTHRKKVIKKLNIKSPTEFLIHAVDLGLVTLPTNR
ncbi:MAG: response regulator transcription factor [Cyclobacteriaceae bacterium]|nr:response regulator transcription factor [Cyclobacteriaceae bacterium]